MKYSSFEVEVETSTLRDPIIEGQSLEIGDFESPHPDNETIWVRLAKKNLIFKLVSYLFNCISCFINYFFLLWDYPKKCLYG